MRPPLSGRPVVAGDSPTPAGSAARQLRFRLGQPGVVLVPGVSNALHGRLAEQAGMEAVFVTGAGVANSSLGVPDLGFATMTELVQVNRDVARALDIPVIADADAGFGGHLNVIRTVRELEAAGVAAIIIEDQLEPKRCGHFAGKSVVSTEVMLQRLVAARRARTDPDLLLIARTDALAVEGLDRALARARAYAAAGADVIFLEAPATREQMAAIPSAVDVPCLINIVEGGQTPMLSLDELEQMGFRLALYANLALRVATKSVRDAFDVLRREGSSQTILDRLISWGERQELVGLPAWDRLDQDIASEAEEIAAAAAVGERQLN